MGLAGCQAPRVGDGGDYAPKAERLPLPSGAGSSMASSRVLLGVDNLEASGFAALDGKRVGLITNQTSINGRGEKTRLVLRRASQVNLVALYTPEHGLDGKEKAGAYVSSRRDSLTGLTAYSLYGKTRKPTAAMLRGIDVLVFDLQDIGARSYTYISTMALAMEACGEHGKEFMVLDRPNPLGGVRVQGPPIESRWLSFVGQLPVPYIHGMTAGELARMANSEGWLKSRCRLAVIPMRGWQRGMAWEHTRLPWVATSPNIPNPRSPFYYAATGIFGSLTGGDIGIGTSGPFEYAGARGVNAREFTTRMNALNFPGVSFTPYRSSVRPGYEGSKIRISPDSSADLVALDVAIIHELNERMSRDLFSTTSRSKKDLFYKVYGSQSLERDLKGGKHPGQIIASWEPHNQRFAQQRARYLLY